jgi:membrane protein required for colicin V production
MEAVHTSYFGIDVIDIGIGVWMLLSAARGFRRGLLREMMAMLALAVALIVAFQWTPDVVPRFAASIPGPVAVDTAVTFVGLFTVVGIALRILAAVVANLWNIGSSPLNKLGGTLFGAGKAGLAIGTAVLVLRTFSPTLPDEKIDARANPVQKLNARVHQSVLAGALATAASSVLSSAADAAEIRLRMLAASDNEGP